MLQGSVGFVGLIGSVFALIGGVVAVAAIKTRNISYLIPLGGILAVIGWAWAATTITDWSFVAYGFYVCLVGGALTAISGIIGAVRWR